MSKKTRFKVVVSKESKTKFIDKLLASELTVVMVSSQRRKDHQVEIFFSSKVGADESAVESYLAKEKKAYEKV